MELVIFAGPNGSGKSTTCSNFIEEYGIKGFEYISPDIYAKEYFSDVENELERYGLAFAYADYKRKSALIEKRNFIVETVNSTTSKFDFYRECKKAGYLITLVFVCTESPEINIKRVALRKTQGGHDVPKDKIVSRYYKSLANLYELSEMSDVVYIYDNSQDNSGAKLCYYKNKFTIQEEVNALPNWVKTYLLEKK